MDCLIIFIEFFVTKMPQMLIKTIKTVKSIKPWIVWNTISHYQYIKCHGVYLEIKQFAVFI